MFDSANVQLYNSDKVWERESMPLRMLVQFYAAFSYFTNVQ